MNKSKFLKKSLAALLAILMVAAMIPLSAAAAVIDVPVYDEDGNQTGTVRDTITASKGTLEGAEGEWTITLPYDSNNNDTEITVGTSRKDIDVFGAVGDAALARLSGGKLSVTGMTQGATKTAMVELRDVEGAAVATYNFTVTKNVASNDTTVTGAKVTLNSKEYTGTVEGNTITFSKLPWGTLTNYAPTASGTPTQITITMPNAKAGVSSVPLTTYANGKGTITVTAQNDNTTEYQVVFEEAECLTGLTIDGVEAVKDETDTTGKTYKVVLDEPNDSSIVAVTTPKASSRFDYGFGSQGSQTLNNPTTIDTSSATTSSPITTYLKVADHTTATDFNEYTIKIEIRKNSDTKVKSLKVTSGSFEETGVVDANGDMTAMLANNTNWASLSATATLTMNGTIKEYSLNDGAVNAVGGTTISLSGLKQNNNIKIVAEDGTTNIYSLNLSADPKTQDKPAVKGAKMKVTTGTSPNEVVTTYTGSIDSTSKTVTFTMPAADTAQHAVIKSDFPKVVTPSSPKIEFEYELTPHTAIGAYTTNVKAAGVGALYTRTGAGTTADPYNYTLIDDYFKVSGYKMTTAAAGSDPAVYEDTLTAVDNTVALTANTGDTWHIEFVKAAVKTESRLNSISFYNAAKKADITDDNTYKGTVTQSNKTVTVAKEVPHALGSSSTKKVTVEFDVSKGAKLFYVINDTVSSQTADRVYAIDKSGFNATTGKTEYEISGDRFVKIKKFIVVNEAGYIDGVTNSNRGVAGITSTTGKTYVSTSGGALEGLTEHTHYEEYKAEIKKTDESQAADLISVKSPDGAVVGFVNAAGSVELVVPETYVVEGKETEFDLVFETSPLSEVTTPATNKNVIEGLKVVANDDGTYSLKDGSTTISKIEVTAEKTAIKKYYTVTVSAKTLSDDTTLNSISVNGVEAKQAGGYGMWSIVLPSGTDLTEITEDSFEVDIVETATYSIAPGEEEDTYVITVTAEDGKTTFDHTVALMVDSEPENPFTDVGDNWATDSIIKAAKLGWIQGKGNGKFDPKGEMTRAQFALIIARIQAGGNDAWEEVAGDYTTDVYDDVSANNDYMNAIAYVTEKEIMSGKGAGKFDPNGTITRQEAAKVMAIASGLEEIPGNTNYSDDASIAGWAKGYVNAVTEKNIMNGMGAGFSPNVKLTREMGATILVRAFDKAEEPEVPAE